MDLTRRIHRTVALALLPLFLIASVLCVCGSAAVATSSAKSAHSCCPSESDGSQEGKSTPRDHRADCNHCGQSQITPDEAAAIPLPHVAPVPWMLASAPFIEFQRPTFTAASPMPRYVPVPYSTDPLFSLKCALLI